MMISAAVLVSIAGLVVVLLLNAIAFAVAWGRSQQRSRDLIDRVEEMFSGLGERIERIELPMGMLTGQSEIMRRADCPLLDNGFRDDFTALKKKVDELEREFRAFAGAKGSTDHD
jgi:hypothetical protein